MSLARVGGDVGSARQTMMRSNVSSGAHAAAGVTVRKAKYVVLIGKGE